MYQLVPIIVFVYDNENWSLIFQKISTGENNYFLFYPGVENKTFCYREDNYQGTFDFSMGNFTKILDENITGIGCTRAGGKSLSDLIIYGNLLGAQSVTSQGSIYHWNGITASNELFNNTLIRDHHYAGDFVKKSDNFYLLFFSSFFDNSYLLKGTPIEQTKK